MRRFSSASSARVKKSDVSIREIADSTDRDNQIGRYLARTGVVLISNVRGFGLLTCAPSFERSSGTPVPPEERDLIGEVDLWAQATGKGTRTRVDVQAVEELAALVTRSVTDFAPIADPADLAKVLARQARDAKESLPDDLRAVASLLDDYRQALGLSFDVDDAKGDRFFRSKLDSDRVLQPFRGLGALGPRPRRGIVRSGEGAGPSANPVSRATLP